MTIKSDVCVVGLGYIGLPTAIMFAASGMFVTGVDILDKVVENVNSGKLHFIEEGLEEVLKKAVEDGKLSATTRIPRSSVYIIAVPTPFKEDHKVDLTYIDSAVENIAPKLIGGELIVLESTSPPGTTKYISEKVYTLRPDLKENSEEQILFAHAPERVLPGKIVEEMYLNDRIVGGLTEKATQKAKELYENFCKGKVYTTDAKTAEMAKLAENSFRNVNIAFANELHLICENLGLNVWELIELANKHPRVNILQPGPGVGGHCIAVDPWFIVSADKNNSKLISTSLEINESKPQYVIKKVLEAIKQRELISKKQGKEKVNVALLGLSFKQDIDDLRQSPALHIADYLTSKSKNAYFAIVEPNISSLPEVLIGKDNVSFSVYEQAVNEADIVVLLVAHKEFANIEQLIRGEQIFINTRG